MIAIQPHQHRPSFHSSTQLSTLLRPHSLSTQSEKAHKRKKAGRPGEISFFSGIFVIAAKRTSTHIYINLVSFGSVFLCTLTTIIIITITIAKSLSEPSPLRSLSKRKVSYAYPNFVLFIYAYILTCIYIDIWLLLLFGAFH